MTRKRIACITSSYPRTESDYAGRFVQEWVQVLGSEFDVQVFTWNDGHQTDVHRVRYAPRRFETLFYGSGAPENIGASHGRLALLPGATGAMIAAVVEDGPYDLVVGHWAVPGGLIARAVGSFLNCPSLVVCHSGGVHQVKRFPWLAKPLRGPTTVITNAQRSVFPDATVLPMGFEKSRVERVGDAILIMSRLVPIKNIERVLNDFREIADHPTIHIAGDGPERSRLEQLAAKNRGPVRFHGFVSGETKDTLIADCGTFLLASTTLDGRQEGMPVALLEAMSAGLVPLVARFDGIEDLLDDAFIVESDESFAERFAELDRSRNVSAMVEDRTWDVLSPRWLDYVRSLV